MASFAPWLTRCSLFADALTNYQPNSAAGLRPNKSSLTRINGVAAPDATVATAICRSRIWAGCVSGFDASVTSSNGGHEQICFLRARADARLGIADQAVAGGIS
jgi:hypothetical protein